MMFRQPSLDFFRDRDSVRSLPVWDVAGRVNGALDAKGIAVLTAPPGAGKSTLIPLTVLQGLADGGKVIMLEPRRLAARQVAERMASLIGEPVGKTVGYRVRFETKVSGDTRVEVLTEGILTRMLVADPTLDGVSAVIFDEFHERNLASDLALALVRQARDLLRPELRILIMSATIDAQRICRELECPLIESEGRMFPVEISYGGEVATEENAAEAVARAVRQVHSGHEGDILAFLPGESEIRRCAEMLSVGLGDTAVMPLYGFLSASEQRKAIAPSRDGERKIVLATPIAETSITIEGVRVVVDSGLCRKMVFDHQSSMSHLETVRISRDMAKQRAGRAGRVAPGVCVRLWNAGIEKNMAENRVPEILEADLAPMVLDVAAWGESDPSALPWLTPPPKYALAKASELLSMLGATDERGHITPEGKRLASLPCHPRIARMLVTASDDACRSLAADVAALLEEKDPLASQQVGADLSLRIFELRRRRRGSAGVQGIWARIERISESYRDMIRGGADNSDPDVYEVGALLASAFPERIARRREGGVYLTASGDLAGLDMADTVAADDWIVVACMNVRSGSSGRIFLAAPLEVSDAMGMARRVDNVSWDSRAGVVVARVEWRIGTLVLDSKPLPDVPGELVLDVLSRAARKDGLSMFDFNDDVNNLQRRISAVASWHPEMELPSVATEDVLASAREWLPLFAGNASTAAALKKIDMCRVVWSRLDYRQQVEVDRLAPSHLEVPTGSRIRVEYRAGADAPVLRVRLQECFGMCDTPRVDGGSMPVLMELLSPGFKPVQLTRDLASFWSNAYFDVRKELRRRYPKHSWPDNPLEAEAVRGVRRKQ